MYASPMASGLCTEMLFRLCSSGEIYGNGSIKVPLCIHCMRVCSMKDSMKSTAYFVTIIFASFLLNIDSALLYTITALRYFE